ncbi:hypothetical protein [Pontibacter liquoris]|uniref:hypothetical protein n=1 Tax=Pontibacter liquoris TaxID=2905677 RepID=UPI001FA73F97|nr:hypothetical protein [Pontibacter liquoris]
MLPELFKEEDLAFGEDDDLDPESELPALLLLPALSLLLDELLEEPLEAEGELEPLELPEPVLNVLLLLLLPKLLLLVLSDDEDGLLDEELPD